MKLSEEFDDTKTLRYQHLIPKTETCLVTVHVKKRKCMAVQPCMDEIMGTPIHWSWVYYRHQ